MRQWLVGHPGCYVRAIRFSDELERFRCGIYWFSARRRLGGSDDDDDDDDDDEKEWVLGADTWLVICSSWFADLVRSWRWEGGGDLAEDIYGRSDYAWGAEGDCEWMNTSMNDFGDVDEEEDKEEPLAILIAMRRLLAQPHLLYLLYLAHYFQQYTLRVHTSRSRTGTQGDTAAFLADTPFWNFGRRSTALCTLSNPFLSPWPETPVSARTCLPY